MNPVRSLLRAPRASTVGNRRVSRPPGAFEPLLRLQAQAGNAAVARLLATVPRTMVQREPTTTIGTPKRKPVDITQLPTREIEQIIAELAGDPDKSAERALAERYVKKRQAAQALIDGFAARAPEESKHFKDITAEDVAKHLKATIEEPHLIDQDQLAWCGPNTFLMVIARNDPVGYARYVTEMYTKGEAKLGAMDVKPGTGVKAEWTTEKMKGADWIALGSLRDSSNWFFSATNEMIGFATFPGDITGWFSKYGVPGGKIVQKGGWIAQTDAGDLTEANKRFDDGWNVLLWVHMFTLGEGGEPEDITTFDIQRTHWVVMNGHFEQDAGTKRWSCPVNTWGTTGARQVRTDADKISSSVWGFIAVDMQAQVRKPEAPIARAG